jgi:enoyl-[acyl-carrier protein] reductase I
MPRSIDVSGKNILVAGVANNESLATFAASALKEGGAGLVITHHPDDRFAKRARKVADNIGIPYSHVLACDVSLPGQVEACVRSAASLFGNRIDGFLHSIGFSDPERLKGSMLEGLDRDNFTNTMLVSVYSFLEMTKYVAPYMTAGGSIVTLTYNASNRPVHSYNMMTLAKAALEASMRLLACELGGNNIRVNAVAASPEKTLSGMAVDGAYQIGQTEEALSLLVRDATPQEVQQDGLKVRGRRATKEEIAHEIVYLMSDFSTGKTGRVEFVNCGADIPGGVPPRNQVVMIRAMGGELPASMKVIEGTHFENAGVPNGSDEGPHVVTLA